VKTADFPDVRNLFEVFLGCSELTESATTKNASTVSVILENSSTAIGVIVRLIEREDHLQSSIP
jgi:hypothetical protein